MAPFHSRMVFFFEEKEKKVRYNTSARTTVAWGFPSTENALVCLTECWQGFAFLFNSRRAFNTLHKTQTQTHLLTPNSEIGGCVPSYYSTIHKTSCNIIRRPWWFCRRLWFVPPSLPRCLTGAPARSRAQPPAFCRPRQTRGISPRPTALRDCRWVACRWKNQKPEAAKKK